MLERLGKQMAAAGTHVGMRLDSISTSFVGYPGLHLKYTTNGDKLARGKWGLSPLERRKIERRPRLLGGRGRGEWRMANGEWRISESANQRRGRCGRLCSG